MKIHSLIIILFLLLQCIAFAQNDDLEFEHITVADGLPDSNVRWIYQDYLGFLWFGTFNGLVKYDGFKMTTYKEKPNDTLKIIGNTVYSIIEDNDRNLWVGHSMGVSVFERDKDAFKTYLYDTNSKDAYANAVANIFQDHSGNIWILTYAKGLIILAKDSTENEKRSYKISRQYLHNPDDSTSIQSGEIRYAYETDNNVLWFGGYFGLSRYNAETDDFTNYNVLEKSKSSYPNEVFNIFQYKSDDIWFATIGDSEAFGIFNQETGEVEYISLHNYDINYPYKDRWPNSSNCIMGEIIINDDGTFWIPSFGGGLMHFYPSARDYRYYINNPDNPKSLGSFYNAIFSIYKDYSGVLWIGTDGGVNKLTNAKSYIQHIKYQEIFLKGMTNKNKINQIFEDSKGILWLGTLYGGLISFDRKSGKKKQYLHDPNNPFSICDNSIAHIMEDKEGFLWLGTINGLSKFDRNQNKFFNYYYTPGDTSGLPDNVVICLYEDAFGDIYIGNSIGVFCKFIKSKNKFIHYFKTPVDSTGMISDTLGLIGQISIDEKGIVWFSSGANLNKFNPEKGLFKKYDLDELSVQGKHAASLFIDSKNRFWMGRDMTGLLRFDTQTEDYKVYSKEDGLPDEKIGSLLEDDEGNIWIRTATSICRFNPDDETFKEIISLNIINSIIYGGYRSKITGEMYFEGDDGIYVFHPDSIKDNAIPPKVVLTDFKVFDESVQTGDGSPLEKHINVAEKITLNHWQNDFTLEFAALHYIDQKRNQYKYMLRGYDENWRDGDVSRLAHYTNMSPGDYLFRVIASNSDGIWNEQGASIKIIILPPWWATTWSYLAYTFLILSIIYFTWKLQVKRIKIKNEYEMSKFEAEKMHEVDEMKSRFFANISHEFRTPLTLIFGPAKDIAENSDDSKARQSAGIINRNATRLYGLVNQLLDLSKLEAGKMKLEASEQNIIPLLKGLVLSFTSLSERKKIALKFNSSAENLNVYINKEKVEKIVNNLLSNAFKFTPEGGKIDFTIEKILNEVEIRITDNGIGIPKERIDKIFDRFYQADSSHTREGEGTGIGLALTKELVELHKGKIMVESKEREGTTFTVKLPLGKDHLKAEEIVEKQGEVVIPEQPEQVIEAENRKEKTEIDVLLDTDKPLLLIVEDNPDVRSYIISHLEDDYRIQEAVDGEDGLEQAIKHIPDLIISDVMMPKMDGFDMCEKLKTDERTSHIPIIMLTAKATSKDKIEGYETGADDYIMKPFDAAELKVRIKNLIEIRRKLQEKFSSDGFNLPKELSSIDEQFMKRVLKAINDHISEEEFSIEELGKEAAISRVYLHRKLKALTGKSPSLFIRSIRLNRAKRLLSEKGGTVAEVAYNFGFGNPAYFTKCFKEEFGCLPSELIR